VLPQEREATVQKFRLGETAVVQEADRISILLDLSDLELPPLSQFRYFRTSHEDEMEYEVLALQGFEKHMLPRGRMTLLIAATG
jgi:hypothetical protein